MNNTLKYIVLFFISVIVQVLLLNNIQLTTLGINPYFYILFLILLPFETPQWLLIPLGFTLGLVVDIFSNSFGVHAFACVLLAGVRPFVLQLLSSREGYDQGTTPRIYYYGFGWFAKYSLILTFLHHFAYYYMEFFRFTNFFRTFWIILFTTLFSFIIILVSQFIMYKK